MEQRFLFFCFCPSSVISEYISLLLSPLSKKLHLFFGTHREFSKKKTAFLSDVVVLRVSRLFKKKALVNFLCSTLPGRHFYHFFSLFLIRAYTVKRSKRCRRRRRRRSTRSSTKRERRVRNAFASSSSSSSKAATNRKRPMSMYARATSAAGGGAQIEWRCDIPQCRISATWHQPLLFAFESSANERRGTTNVKVEAKAGTELQRWGKQRTRHPQSSRCCSIATASSSRRKSCTDWRTTRPLHIWCASGTGSANEWTPLVLRRAREYGRWRETENAMAF